MKTNEGLKEALLILNNLFKDNDLIEIYHHLSINNLVQIGQVIEHSLERIEELEKIVQDYKEKEIWDAITEKESI